MIFTKDSYVAFYLPIFNARSEYPPTHQEHSNRGIYGYITALHTLLQKQKPKKRKFHSKSFWNNLDLMWSIILRGCNLNRTLPLFPMMSFDLLQTFPVRLQQYQKLPPSLGFFSIIKKVESNLYVLNFSQV